MLDADSGAVIATLDTKPSGSFSSVSGVSWSPDDSRLVVWSGSGHMRMFRTDPLEPGTEPVEPLALLTEGKLELFRLGVAWSADGRRLIGEASERPQRCSLWSGETGKRLKTWEARGNVSFADRQPLWSHDSSRWARIAANGAVHVHDPNGETLVEIPTKGVEVHRFAWATDGLRLATVGGWPGPAALWDGVTGERIADLEGGAERLAFSPDGLLVATASARAGQAGDTENPVRLYDARSGALLVVLPGHQGAIMSLAWSADSGTVATASSHWLEPLRTWDVKTILAEPKALVVLAERRAHLRLAPSGKLEPSTPR
jgi:WD40 repeat protein